MKLIIANFLFILSLVCLGQTSEAYLEKGVELHRNKDFKGAVKAYSKAIKEDENNKLAYFNRGTCELALKNYKSAKSDFDQTLKIDPEYVTAYYSRASVYVSMAEYKAALPDLDKTIELDETLPNALTLRGQIRAQTGNKVGACEDFNRAKALGDAMAEEYLSQFCGNEMQNGESLLLHWPEEENWKIGNSQENDQMALLELIHSDETIDNWTEMGTMMSVKGAKDVPMDMVMNMMFDEAKKNAPKAKLTFIEKDESAEFPWILFTIESPKFKNDKTPESQLWYIIQGKTSLYTNFRAIKEKSIPETLKNKWVAFFKTGKIVYK